jgi:hypothetical protein
MTEISSAGTMKRKPLETIKQTIPVVGRRSSSLIAPDADKTEVRKLKMTMAEKDKQLSFLEQQLLISQAHVEELLAGSEKHKRQEREAKKDLSSKETHLRRQTVALKHSDDKLQRFLMKENDKIRRSKMERQELEAELERVEDEHEEQTSKNLAEIKNLEDLVICMKDESSALLAIEIEDMNKKTSEMDARYTKENTLLSDAVNKLKSQTAALQTENISLKATMGKMSTKSSLTTSKVGTISKDAINLQAINEKSILKLEDQSREIAQIKEKNKKLQNLIEELSLEKSSIKSDKEVQLAEFITQSHLRVQKMQAESVEKEKADQLTSAPADAARLSEETDVQTNSVTELWKSLRVLEQSEKNAKALMEQAFKMLHVADSELNSKLLCLKACREVKLLTDQELLDSAEKIEQLTIANRSLEEALKSTRAEINPVTQSSTAVMPSKSEKGNKSSVSSRLSSDSAVKPGKDMKRLSSGLSAASKISPVRTSTSQKATSEKAEKAVDKSSQDATKVQLQVVQTQLEESKRQIEVAEAKCSLFEIESCGKSHQLLSAQEELEKVTTELKVSADARAKLANDLAEADARTVVVERGYKVLETMLREAIEKQEASEKESLFQKERLLFSQKNAEGLRGQLTGSKINADTLRTELEVTQIKTDTLRTELEVTQKSSTVLLEELLVGQRNADQMKENDNGYKSPETMRVELVTSQQTVSALRWDLNKRQKSFDNQKGELALSQQSLTAADISLQNAKNELAAAVRQILITELLALRQLTKFLLFLDTDCEDYSSGGTNDCSGEDGESMVYFVSSYPTTCY